MQRLTPKMVSPGSFRLGLYALLGLSLFFVGQIITQLGTTAPYSPAHQAISELGITACGNFKEPQTHLSPYVCSPLHLVMDGTFIVYGALIMLVTMLAIRPLWPGRRLRGLGILLIFFGGIESVVAGFSPLNVAPFLHSLSGGLAISTLNIGLILLGFAAIKTQKVLGTFTLLAGFVGMIGFIMNGTPPYAGLGYGGWERVAGFAFALWGIVVGAYWLLALRNYQNSDLAKK